MTNRYDVGIVAPIGGSHRKRRGKQIVCSACGKGNVTLCKHDDGKYYGAIKSEQLKEKQY